MSSYQTIGSPVLYGGLKLKNRIIFAPTSMGVAPDEMIERMRQIAAGGCAMIVIGDVSVLPHGFGPSLYSKKGMDFYKRLAQAVHSENCLLCAQLHQSDSNLRAMFKYVPGVLTKKISKAELRPLLNKEVGPYITGMSTAQITKIIRAFGRAAVLAKQAGFDMIQVHGDRMCGSFSSSIYNHRTDMYGQSAENRARFACEAVRSVREQLPDIPIDYKLAVRRENPHYGNAGVLESELPVFIPLLEQAGVTSFHVTLANHGELEDTIPSAKHPYFGQEGCFLPFCDQVRALTTLPVCGVGGLTDPDFVEQQIKVGRMDCAAMSRALIADPQWPNKAMSGKVNEIRRCVRCNRACLGGMMAHKGVHCIYEKEIEQ
ncbi:bilirubin reductase [uncultured Ruthenibacterium sp.]|uniref:bilirubin reductase n=1 Tax=uncultured Ruthenibacterium sp. TaxID=1905347 RepID=UPI00349E9416